MEGYSIKAVAWLVAIVLAIAWVSTKIPDHRIMYDNKPICPTGQPTMEEGKVKCR